jgi:hypothetical protein
MNYDGLEILCECVFVLLAHFPFINAMPIIRDEMN